jgi:hypothetical protein
VRRSAITMIASCVTLGVGGMWVDCALEKEHVTGLGAEAPVVCAEAPVLFQTDTEDDTSSCD